MKKNQSRRSLVIVLLLFAGIVVIGVTAAAVYAGRFMSREVNSFLSQLTAENIEPLAQGSGALDNGTSIYEQGLLVTAVTSNGPAQQAGIRRGSIILAVDNQEVSDLAQLAELLASKGGGAAVSVTVLNSPTPEELEVTLAAEPPLLGVQIAGSGYESRFGQFPKEFDLSDIPEEFHFDPDSMPFTPEDFGFGQGALPSGVLVVEVVAGSGAELAGLTPGDVIEAIDDQAVSSVEQLGELLAGFESGDSVDLTIVREGAKEDITVRLGEHPEQNGRGFLGIQPAPLRLGPGSMGGRGNFGPLGIPFQGEMPIGGAVIVAVIDGSPAARAGLQIGDIIEGVNRQTVATVDELIQMIGDNSPGETITLTVMRKNQMQEVEVTLASNPEDVNRAYLGIHLGALFNVELNELDGEEGMLPDESFYHLQPNFNPSELFNFPGNLQDMIPDIEPGERQEEPQEQDA